MLDLIPDTKATHVRAPASVLSSVVVNSQSPAAISVHDMKGYDGAGMVLD